MAHANILEYQDLGDVIHWTSDATCGYIVENYHITQVQRCRDLRQAGYHGGI